MSTLRRIAQAIARFRGARDGSAAVEFSMIALPFFLLTFGLAEIALIGFAQANLDFAVSDTARLIRTGQAQEQNLTYAQMKNTLCSEVNAMMPLNCTANLYLDVQTFTSFVNVTNNNPVQAGTFNASGFGYNPGTPASIVVVRAYYRWQVITPFFQTVFANISGGQRVLASTMMFRNEPYST